MSTSSSQRRVWHSSLLITAEVIWRLSRTLMLHLKRNKDAQVTQQQVERLDECYRQMAALLHEIQGA